MQLRAPFGDGPVQPVVRSGLIAAHTILSVEGNYSARKLALHRELLKARLQRERSRLDTLSQLLPHAMREILGRQLLRSRSFCRNVVVDRWFLRVAEPRLACEPQHVQRELTAI